MNALHNPEPRKRRTASREVDALLDLTPTGKAGDYFLGVLASTLETDGEITAESWAEAARKAVEYEATAPR